MISIENNSWDFQAGGWRVELKSGGGQGKQESVQRGSHNVTVLVLTIAIQFRRDFPG